VITLDTSQGGGAYGVWVAQKDKSIIELAGVEGLASRTE